ncbi:glycoside hydrolase family 6 protein [Actinoplanes sp. TRM 88003]|uniref:Glucanase n=1 Tax=Paractinoplanes aksuensis TaxID=2939490 RepID=A0ABT1E2A9_9ACTN|nr:glycoside hydrolase family 6 protein [Actinoplanes aksuensis]MCO8277280.1 glycoside hydrolase family 6 protein [Actinoplanes aksuensis]
MARHRASRRGKLLALAVTVVVAVTAVVWLARPENSAPVATPAPPPSSAPPAALYVEPTGPAVDQVTAFEAAGRTADAALIREIADRPVAAWIADPNTARAGEVAAAAAAAVQIPVLVLYYIPHRDCSGGHSAGGAGSAAEYTAWVAAVASALTDRRAIVILEPDAVAQAVEDCLTNTQRAERYRLLTEAITTLTANPQLSVYLDGGNPTWITDPERMAAGLRQAGVEKAAGFALNVANFETTDANITYGTAVSGHLEDARFVIDTSRNGNGPAVKSAGHTHWCNPAGRALGDPPTLTTGHSLVDAFLWIKRPGESDGACGNDAPEAGQWWPDYALQLAAN